MGKFIIFAPVWNDMDWLEAMINQIDYWKPDLLCFCEGCFDKKYPARSTDGTREYLEEIVKHRDNTWLIDNTRENDYRTNSVNQCRKVCELAEAKGGDWVMYQACDFYMLKKHIDIYKELMTQPHWHYPIFEIMNFWDSTELYYSKWAEMALNLPWRLVKDYTWEPICHLAKNGTLYNNHPKVVSRRLKVKGFHYEGFRNKERLHQKYDVGNKSDRESPVTWKDGIKLKKRSKYTGEHPEFVIPVLQEKGYL